MIEFEAFPKIPRYRREVALTEKIDGTNAAVRWEIVTDDLLDNPNVLDAQYLKDQHGADLGFHLLFAQSRNQFVIPGKDNYGFAKWVQENAEDLKTLGPGTHYGEWWGSGIQRGYGQAQKNFSLFNVARWGAERQTPPVCCRVVPLFGYFQPSAIEHVLNVMRDTGSMAAPGYMRPEGLIVWHTQSKQYYKILIEGDDTPKSLQNVAA